MKSLILLLLPLILEAQQPDIILLVTDDQNDEEQRVLPITNSLFNVVFEDAVAHTTLCDPSRATILTGLYRDEHLVGGNQQEQFFDWRKSFSWDLHEAGYRTGLVGKDFAGDYWRAPVPGFDVFLNNSINHDQICPNSVAFINQSPVSQPLFLFVGFKSPHYDARFAPQDAGLFNDELPYRPPNWNEKNVSDKPVWVRRLHLLSKSQIDSLDAFYIRRLKSLQRVDRQVRDIIEAEVLRGRPYVLIFVSDHGLQIGNHRRFREKFCNYEECERIPFMVTAFDGIPHTDNSHPVSLVDIYRTVMDYAGLAPAPDRHGASLRPLIRDEETLVWRDATFHDSGERGRSLMENEGIRTQDGWQYNQYVNGDRELYDLINDPWEMENKAGLPAYAAKQAELQARLNVLRAE